MTDPDNQIESAIRQAMPEHNIPGLAVAVTDGGEPVFSGPLHQFGEPNGVNSLFPSLEAIGLDP